MKSDGVFLLSHAGSAVVRAKTGEPAQGDGDALELWGGKATQNWQGTAQRGSSQSSAKGLSCCSLVTLIWPLLSRVHISVPIHKKQCKPFGHFWPVPVGAIPLLPRSTFMYQAWLHQSRACHTDTFQDRVKTICSLETHRVPREGVKPREYWSVSCLCYDFCHVTQSRPPTSLSEPGQLSQQGMDCCRPPHLTASLQNSRLVFRLILPQNWWVLTAFTPKYCRTEQRGGRQGEGSAPWSAAYLEGIPRAINSTHCYLYGSQHCPLGKNP